MSEPRCPGCNATLTLPHDASEQELSCAVCAKRVRVRHASETVSAEGIVIEPAFSPAASSDLVSEIPEPPAPGIPVSSLLTNPLPSILRDKEPGRTKFLHRTFWAFWVLFLALILPVGIMTGGVGAIVLLVLSLVFATGIAGICTYYVAILSVLFSSSGRLWLRAFCWCWVIFLVIGFSHLEPKPDTKQVIEDLLYLVLIVTLAAACGAGLLVPVLALFEQRGVPRKPQDVAKPSSPIENPPHDSIQPADRS
jgi:hypothetical protein